MRAWYLIEKTMKTILTIVAVIISFNSFSQILGKGDRTLACDSTLVYRIVQEMPEYENGKKQLFMDMKAIIDISNNVEGTVYTEFIINCKGEAVHHVVLRGIDAHTDKEVIEKLKKLQKWRSGTQRGEKVDVYYTIHVKLKNGKCVNESRY